MSIPQAFVERVLDQTDLVELVSTAVQLKKVGSDFVGLCPFHNEKSPSFTVVTKKERPFYHCFGCGVNGDAISFLTEYGGLEFREAVGKLAGNLGMRIPEEERLDPNQRRAVNEQHELVRSIKQINTMAAKAYQDALHRPGSAGMAYLRGRDVTVEAIDRFALGYAPPGWRFLAGHLPEYRGRPAVEADLVVVKEPDGASPADGQGETTDAYDRFRDRVMFPIKNIAGEIVGFGGRVLAGKEVAKYLNTSETPAFTKGRELYGLYEARQEITQSRFAVVVEGYMDVVAMWMHGVRNAVSTLGTACTADQIRKIFRQTDRVVFCFDGDAAGDKAAVRAMENVLPFMVEGKTVRFARLPSPHDPDSYLREEGRAKFDAFLSGARPLSRFLIDIASQDCDMALPEGRAEMLDRARQLWIKLPQGAFADQMLGEIARQAMADGVQIATTWAADAAAQREMPPENSAGATGWVAPESRAVKPGHRGGRDHGRPSSHETDVLREMGGLGADRRPGRFGKKPTDPGSRPYGAGNGFVPGQQRGGATPDSRVCSMLLRDMTFWPRLSDDEIGALAAMAEPYSGVIRWLESIFVEEGAVPWDTLRGRLPGSGLEGTILQLMTDVDPLGKPEAEPLNVIRIRVVTLRVARLRERLATLSCNPSQDDMAECVRLTTRLRELADEERRLRERQDAS